MGRWARNANNVADPTVSPLKTLGVARVLEPQNVTQSSMAAVPVRRGQEETSESKSLGESTEALALLSLSSCIREAGTVDSLT